MTYSLEFDARALKEWQKLGDTIRQQLKKKLVEILNNPRIEANRLHGFPTATRSNYVAAVTA
jgi:mRNA interferase RelE/StbE